MISNFTLIGPTGFVKQVLNGTIIHYLADRDFDSLDLFTRNWTFIRNLAIAGPRSVYILENFIYLVSHDTLYKLTFDLSIANKTSIFSCSYRRFVFVPTYNHFYVSNDCLNAIEIFNLDLSQVNTIILNTDSPASLDFHAGSVYVGTFSNAILVIENGTLTRRITNICQSASEYINSFYVDFEGNMACACQTDSMIKLYNTNGTFMGLSFKFDEKMSLISFDDAGRFLVSQGNPTNSLAINGGIHIFNQIF